MYNQRGSGLIIGILIGLVLAGGLFGIYYLGTQQNNTSTNPPVTSQTPAPAIKSSSKPSNQPAATASSSAKTYTSSKYKISFSYPNSYIPYEMSQDKLFLTVTPDEKKAIVDCFAKDPSGCVNFSLSINFNEEDKDKNQTLAEFVSAFTKSESSKFNPITIAGLSALQYQSEGSSTIVNSIFVDRGNTVLQIQGISALNKKENNANFSKLITTMKFN